MRSVAFAAFVGLVALLPGSFTPLANAWSEVPVQFIRGDTNADAGLGIEDAILTLHYLFLGEAPPSCLKAADVDDDGAVDIVDPIRVLLHLFDGSTPPGAPYPACGVDPTDDGLSCVACPPCEFETLLSGYGIIRTIAGTGRLQDVNGWLTEYEGQPADTVELSNPHFTMGDAAGNLFLADKESHAIRKVTPDGKISTAAGINAPGDGQDDPAQGTSVALSSPNGLWVRQDSTVYILDLGNGKVRRLDPAGTMRTLFEVPGGIIVGRGIWVSDDESTAYVASNSEIKRWTAEGGVETFATGFASLGNIVMGPDGRLVATDRGANRVYRVDGDGELTPIAGNGSTSGGGDGAPALDTGLDGVRAVWFVPPGGLLLGTHRGSQVWYVDTRGIIHLFLDGARGAHSGDGEHFRTPGAKVSEVRAVTVDASGNVLVTEHDYGYIRMIERLQPASPGQ